MDYGVTLRPVQSGQL